MRFFLRSKIHNATVTDANVDYVGSLTIDADLMEKSDIQEHEKVLVVDNTNGARLETYVIKGNRGSGDICANGAASHMIKKGHQVIIMTFAMALRAPRSKIVLVDRENRFVKYLHEKPGAPAG
ncbi:MAG: aspartate 1-decarboxylase [Elusimicrobia bacterium]|jgi:aspartate 1-decarboxylase|nr:aspartate 1-decarboxylase [Elusimicrobiota bacterium]